MSQIARPRPDSPAEPRREIGLTEDGETRQTHDSGDDDDNASIDDVGSQTQEEEAEAQFSKCQGGNAHGLGGEVEMHADAEVFRWLNVLDMSTCAVMDLGDDDDVFGGENNLRLDGSVLRPSRAGHNQEGLTIDTNIDASSHPNQRTILSLTQMRRATITMLKPIRVPQTARISGPLLISGGSEEEVSSAMGGSPVMRERDRCRNLRLFSRWRFLYVGCHAKLAPLHEDLLPNLGSRCCRGTHSYAPDAVPRRALLVMLETPGFSNESVSRVHFSAITLWGVITSEAASTSMFA